MRSDIPRATSVYPSAHEILGIRTECKRYYSLPSDSSDLRSDCPFRPQPIRWSWLVNQLPENVPQASFQFPLMATLFVKPSRALLLRNVQKAQPLCMWKGKVSALLFSSSPFQAFFRPNRRFLSGTMTGGRVPCGLTWEVG